MQQEGRPPPVLDLDEPGNSPSSVPSIQTSADPLTRAKAAGMIVNKCVFKDLEIKIMMHTNILEIFGHF